MVIFYLLAIVCDLESLYNEATKEEKNGEKVNTGYGSTLSAAAEEGEKKKQ